MTVDIILNILLAIILIVGFFAGVELRSRRKRLLNLSGLLLSTVSMIAFFWFIALLTIK